ncbi:hypothetical protein NFI96_002097 [Prochilodus magdalenae]|nr:hypothetical protein NFI96_002097 [Prochilodus magdalenae]
MSADRLALLLLRAGMAGSSAVRLRLRFDYPPPAGPQCRMSWILLDLNRCRVIADLCSEIRERFGYSRRAELDLFIDECYLPPPESIYLVRDNDSIRVKVSSHCVISAQTTGKKRSREDEELPMELDDGVVGPKKSRSEESQGNGFNQPEETKKKKKKKKKKKVENRAAVEPAAPAKEPVTSKTLSEKTIKKAAGPSVSANGKPSAASKKQLETSDSSDSSPQKPPPPKPKPKAKQTAPARAKESTSSECSSSSEDDAPSKPGKPNVTVKPSTPKPPSTSSKPSAEKPATQPSSDSSLDSSSSPAPPAKKVPPPPAVQNGPASVPSTPVVRKNENKPESSDSDSGSEIELVIKTPNPQILGMTLRGGGRVRGRGGGRGGRVRDHVGGRGGFGRAKGTPWKQNFDYSYDSWEQQKQDDLQTNRSFVIEVSGRPDAQWAFSVPHIRFLPN